MKKWQIREQFSDDLEAQLLAIRGIKSEEEKSRFFKPNFDKDLHDPFLMKDMDKGVKRILEAVSKNEKILVFGDYDADGICGAIIFYDFFKKIGFDNFDVYIPDRYKEGYGLTLEAIEQFKKDNVNLIITIDCGVTACEEVEKANSFGIDTVVTDHHLPAEKLPPAVAIIDSKQNGDNYPYKFLCGAAVAFKTVEALLKKGGFNVTEGWHKWLLDAVCVATVADMVPLTGENRVLVYYGLEVLKKTPRYGLSSLIKKLQIKKASIVEDDIAFLIAPRINATSRMDHATTSYNLLTTDKKEEAEWLIERISEKNQEQKDLAEKTFEEINALMASRTDMPDVLVFGNENWLPGLLGIVANKVVEKYNRPVFLWGKKDSPDIKGSGRSNGSVNLVALMNKIEEGFFIDHGGHAMAAGFSFTNDKISLFEPVIKKAFERSKCEKIEDVLWIDKEIDFENVGWNFLNLVLKFKPFGIGNEKPVFLFKNLTVFAVKTFGNGGIHLQLDFKKQNNEKVSAIGFFMKDSCVNEENGCRFDIKPGMSIDMLASIEKSGFKGYDELRLRIVDFRICGQ